MLATGFRPRKDQARLTSESPFASPYWVLTKTSDPLRTSKRCTAPVATPLDPAGAGDDAGLVRHCQWLLASGCDGRAL